MRGIRSAVACALVTMAPFAAIDQANAATIDTFSFTQSGYLPVEPFLGPFGPLSGTFTGTVESSSQPYPGYIMLSDLSSFSASFLLPQAASLNFPSLFVFDVAALPNTSSLDFESSFPGETTSMCVGLAAAFGNCGVLPTDLSPVGVNGAVGVPDFLVLYTSEFPTITLVSSVTTTPLPPTWTMLIAGFAALGFFAYLGTKNRSAAVAAS
jgi:hypothetical protein